MKRRYSHPMRLSNAIVSFTQAALIAVITLLFYTPLRYAEFSPLSDSSKKSYTIMFYLNGDNSLTQEVLHTLDMLETVGSSDEINILALVDGRPGADHGYGNGWDGSKLIYVTHDARIGEINSLILQDMDEQNLGSPETLESFIQKCLKFRAERYIFCTFAHGRGIIDTKTLTTPGAHKSLAISIDETDKTQLTLQEFRSAIQRGLDGQKFDAMVFFSCLTGMVEVAYALKDLTGYLIASEDEIRIVNDPPGSFQIRGIKFEEPLKAIRNNPYLSIADFGKVTIDKFIEQYTRDVNLKDVNGQPYHCRYPATLAILDCRTFDQLASYLNHFADYIVERLQASHNAAPLLKEIRFTLSETQRYASFLNLEYFDVQDLFLKLAAKTGDEHLKKLCHEVVDFVKTKVIVYERHTLDSASNGLSIYFPHPLIPENIFQCHQAMYRKSEFSKHTSWDEMIEIVRRQMTFDGKRF